MRRNWFEGWSRREFLDPEDPSQRLQIGHARVDLQIGFQHALHVADRSADINAGAAQAPNL